MNHAVERAETSEERYHGFDALRAAMVLLGIVIHSACCYTTVPVPVIPHHDISTHPVFDWICVILHTFRMPVFFVMAGFFTAMLLARKGADGMLANRWRRLMIPLLMGWPILGPLLLMGLVFTWRRHPDFESGGAVAHLPEGQREIDSLLAHLWFLYDLFLFCLMAWAWDKTTARWMPRLPGIVATVYGKLLRNGGAFFAMVVLTVLSLFPMQTGTFDTSASPLPPIRILTAYGLFFAFGFLLHGQREALSVFCKAPGWRVACGVVLIVPMQVGLFLMNQNPSTVETGSPVHWMTIGLGSLACWLLVYGLIGLCLKYYTRPRFWVRYLTDASYWLYLAHLPLIFFLHGALAPYPISALLKFAVVLGVSTVLLLVSYDSAVRDSRIGEHLNGRRYPRIWKKAEAD